MTDQEATSAEEIRNEKLKAARRKLKRFQNRKTDQVDDNSENSSNMAPCEESQYGGNDILAFDQTPPSSKCIGPDEAIVQMPPLDSKHHALQLPSTTSSPLSQSSSPSTAVTHTPLTSSSSPPPSLGDSAEHWNLSLSGPSANSHKCQYDDGKTKLEEVPKEVANSQSGTTTTMNSDISSQSDKDDTTNTTSIDYIQRLEQNYEMTMQQLTTTKQQLDDNTLTVSNLKEQMNHLEQERSTLKQQLDASQQSIAMKDEELETASVDLGHLEQQYTSIKQTLNEKESLYTDLLKTKGDIEQQLQHTTKQNQENYTQQQLYIRKLEDNQVFESQHQILKQQVEMVQQEMEGTRELANTTEKARSNLHEEHIATQSQLESARTHLEAQQALVATLNAQLQNRADQIGEMDTKIKALETEKNDMVMEWELKQKSLEEEKGQQEASLKSAKSAMDQLQQQVNDLKQQLVSERATISAANDTIKQQTDELERMAQNDLLQQERDRRQEEVGSLSSEIAALRRQLVESQDETQQHTQRYNDNVAALAVSTQKHDDMEQLLEQTRYWWMAEQTKVANMTEDVTQLRRQVQQNMNDRQKLQRQLDETKQLLANRDQNAEALQWQVTDMESSTQHQLHLLSRQLKDAHEEAAMKTKQVEQLQDQLSAITLAATRATATIDQQSAAISSIPPPSSPLTKPLPQSPPPINTEPQPSKRELQMEIEMKELQQRLERQFEAFSTIRDELTTVRDRQLDVELTASKEKDHLIREQKEMEQTINKLRTEYQDHLQHIWTQHQATRHHHEEDLTLGRNALDAAQVKLMQNGLSPVSENGFDWMNTEDDEHGHDHDSNHNHDNRMGTIDNTPPTNTAITTQSSTLGSTVTSKSPSLGVVPPLKKPAFSEFLDTPRCSGCRTEVIEI